MSNNPEPAFLSCAICSGLQERQCSYHKYGWEENDIDLPEAARHLTVVRDFDPNASRLLQLKQCPDCGTFYLYKTDYEYLVNGSEDEEILTRLTPEQAAEYLNPLVKGEN